MCYAINAYVHNSKWGFSWKFAQQAGFRVSDNSRNCRGDFSFFFFPVAVTAAIVGNGGRNHLQQKTYFSRTNNITNICMDKCARQSVVMREDKNTSFEEYNQRLLARKYCHLRNE